MSTIADRLLKTNLQQDQQCIPGIKDQQQTNDKWQNRQLSGRPPQKPPTTTTTRQAGRRPNADKLIGNCPPVLRTTTHCVLKAQLPRTKMKVLCVFLSVSPTCTGTYICLMQSIKSIQTIWKTTTNFPNYAIAATKRSLELSTPC